MPSPTLTPPPAASRPPHDKEARWGRRLVAASDRARVAQGRPQAAPPSNPQPAFETISPQASRRGDPERSDGPIQLSGLGAPASAFSADSAVNALVPSDPSTQIDSTVPSVAGASPPRRVVKNDLLTDLLSDQFTLADLATRHGIPLDDLLAWLQSDETQRLLAAAERINSWRSRYFSIERVPRALNRLCEVMDSHPGTETARRAATTIINMAFRKDPWAAPGAARATDSQRRVSADRGSNPAPLDDGGRAGCHALVSSPSRASQPSRPTQPESSAPHIEETSTPPGRNAIDDDAASSGGFASPGGPACAQPPATNEQPTGPPVPCPAPEPESRSANSAPLRETSPPDPRAPT